MNSERQSDDLDRIITAWFEAGANVRESDRLIRGVFERTQRTRPRPTWLLPERWIPMQLTTSMRRVPSVAPVLLLIALLLAVALAVAYAASRPRVPAPFGPATNGRIAFNYGGSSYTTDANGQNLRQLTFGGGLATSPVFSRDGTKVAYRHHLTDAPDDDPSVRVEMVVADADGNHPVVVGQPAKAFTNPSWSPDGRFVAFVPYPATNDPERVVVAAADGSSTKVFGDLGGSPWGPTWSPDGQQLVVGVADTAIGVVDRDGSNYRKLNTGSYVEIGQKGEIAEWSPDGKSIIFSASLIAPDVDRQLFIVGLDGQAERPFVSPTVYEDGAVWSPDGTQVAFLRGISKVRAVVVIADATGREIRVLPQQVGFFEPVWSPDGKKILTVISQEGATDPPQVLILDAADAAPVVTVNLPPTSVPQHEPDFAGSWQRVAP